jgi:hypothetical protein
MSLRRSSPSVEAWPDATTRLDSRRCGDAPYCYNATMKSCLIAGLVLIAAGIFLILRPPHYAAEQSVFKVGGFEARMQQDRPLPDWVGGAVLGAGIALLGFTLLKRR